MLCVPLIFALLPTLNCCKGVRGELWVFLKTYVAVGAFQRTNSAYILDGSVQESVTWVSIRP